MDVAGPRTKALDRIQPIREILLDQGGRAVAKLDGDLDEGEVGVMPAPRQVVTAIARTDGADGKESPLGHRTLKLLARLCDDRWRLSSGSELLRLRKAMQPKHENGTRGLRLAPTARTQNDRENEQRGKSKTSHLETTDKGSDNQA